LAIHFRKLPVSRRSDFETECPLLWLLLLLLLLAKAGFAMAVEDTSIATVAIASNAKVVVVAFVFIFPSHSNMPELINLLLNLVKGILF
jgi:hypothetical protein